MSTNHDALLGITGYPIPERTLEAVALRRGLTLTDTATSTGMTSAAFRLCEADLLMWLYRAPNVSQGGQSYNFTDVQRASFKSRAKGIYHDCGDEGSIAGADINYGYKGSRI